MKKILVIISVILVMLTQAPLLISISQAQTTKEQKKEIIVYITKTGAKYHRGSCSYLRKSKISIAKKEAIANGYSACSRCNP
jgi:biopolymer transport protein ExbD